MPRRGEPFKAHPPWTQARFFSFLRSNLRKAWLKYPPRLEKIKESRKTVEGKKHKYEIQCESCGEWKRQKEIQVDHVKPVGSLKRFEDLPRFTRRLFCSKEGLMLLCTTCHWRKTHGSNS